MKKLYYKFLCWLLRQLFSVEERIYLADAIQRTQEWHRIESKYNRDMICWSNHDEDVQKYIDLGKKWELIALKDSSKEYEWNYQSMKYERAN